MRQDYFLAAGIAILLTQPAWAQSPSHNIVISPTMQGSLICVTGDTLCMAGPDTLRDFSMCVLSADRHRVAGQQQNYEPLNPQYAFRWIADTAGTHRLSLDYVLENGELVNSRRWVVQVQNTPPVVLMPLPAQFYGAASGHDLPVTVQVAPDFRASEIDWFLDGQNVGSVTQAPFGFVLPLGGTLTGPHQVFVQATDSSGDIYTSPTQTIIVASGRAPGETLAPTTKIARAGSAKTAPHQTAKPKKSRGRAR